jgi:hypothetical protein
VHVDEVALSPAWVYSVIPFGPVRTVPNLAELAVPTITPAAPDPPPPIGAGLA